MFVVEDRLDEAAGDHCNACIREALEVDDIVGGLDEPLLDILAVEFFLKVEVLVEMVDAKPRTVDG